MLTWVLENLATILIGLGLLCIVAVIVRGMIRDKKKGKSSCGCNCANCAMGSVCHKEK